MRQPRFARSNVALRWAALSLLLVQPSAVPAQTGGQAPPVLTDQVSGTSALPQAVSVVSDRVVWASGHNATFVRTTDGGATWLAGTVPGDAKLQFRDVHAVSADTAYLMSAGTGGQSRIYRTNDGGRHWTLQFTDPDSLGFYDCMGFWNARHGLVYGDEIGGSMVMVATDDGTRWARVPPDRLPVPRPGEGAFAASGTCLTTLGDRHAWISTGAGLAARVLRTADRGRTWAVSETPIVHGTRTAGTLTVAFRDTLHGMTLGGDIADTVGFSDNVAVTKDGGATWTIAGRPTFPGAVYGSSYVPGAATPTAVAVGPRGASYSRDNGTTWTKLDSRNYWSLGFTSGTVGWLVGPGGRITRVDFGSR